MDPSQYSGLSPTGRQKLRSLQNIASIATIDKSGIKKKQILDYNYHD